MCVFVCGGRPWLTTLEQTLISLKQMEKQECLNGFLIKVKGTLQGRNFGCNLSPSFSSHPQTGNSVGQNSSPFSKPLLPTEAVGPALTCPGLPWGPGVELVLELSPHRLQSSHSGSFVPPGQQSGHQGPGIEILKSSDRLRKGCLAVLDGLVSGWEKEGSWEHEPWRGRTRQGQRSEVRP